MTLRLPSAANPQTRQRVLDRRLEAIYDCYLQLKDINRELRWSDLPVGSFKSLKALLRECLQSSEPTEKHINLASSVAAEEEHIKSVDLQTSSGAGSVEEEAHDRNFETCIGTSSGTKSLSVTNFSSAINASRLRREFGRFGGITDCRIIYKSKLGYSEAVAYIEFANSKDAAKAKDELNHSVLDGYLLNVAFDAPRNKVDQISLSAEEQPRTLGTDQASRRYAVPPAPRGGWPEELEIELPCSYHQTPLEQIFPNGSPELATFEQVRKQLRGVQISDADDWELHGSNLEEPVSEKPCTANKLNSKTIRMFRRFDTDSITDRSYQNAYRFVGEDAADVQALITSLEIEIGKLHPSEPNFASRWRTLSDQYDLACDRYVKITDARPDTQWTVPKFGKADITNMQFETSPSGVSDMHWAFNRMDGIMGGHVGANNPFLAGLTEALSNLKYGDNDWANESSTSSPKQQREAAKEANSPAKDVTNTSAQWTTDEDEELIFFRASWPSEPWATIAEELGKTRRECEERHKVIEAERALAKVTKEQRAKLAKQDVTGTMESERPVSKHAKKKLSKKEKKELKQKPKFYMDKDYPSLGSMDDKLVKSPSPHSDILGDRYPKFPVGRSDWVCQHRDVAAKEEVSDCWASTAAGGDAPAVGWGPDPNAAVSEERVDSWGAADSPAQSYPIGDGWNCPEECVQPEQFRGEKATPEPTTPASKPYTVTYWATVECDGQEAHIPIDSNDVTGSEKTVLDGPAKTVWKWAQEKGLCDKISLRDAFDLAKDMTMAREEVQGAQEKEENWQGPTGYTSHTVSSSAPPRPSRSRPSPLSRAWGGRILRSPSPQAWRRRASRSPSPQPWRRCASPISMPSDDGGSGSAWSDHRPRFGPQMGMWRDYYNSG